MFFTYFFNNSFASSRVLHTQSRFRHKLSNTNQSVLSSNFVQACWLVEKAGIVQMLLVHFTAAPFCCQFPSNAELRKVGNNFTLANCLLLVEISFTFDTKLFQVKVQINVDKICCAFDEYSYFLEQSFTVPALSSSQFQLQKINSNFC